MAEQTKRNWKIWALVAVLAVAGGGYAAKSMMEKKMADDIANALANLPGGFTLKAETISVDVFSKSAVLSKIAGSGKIGDEAVNLSADSAEGAGLNLKAFKEKGTTTLADVLTLRGVKASGSGIDFSAGLYHLEKVRGDFAALSEQGIKLWGIIHANQAATRANDKAALKKAEADLLAVLRDDAFSDAVSTLHIGKTRVEQYAVSMNMASPKFPNGPKIAIRMDFSESSEYSATHCGPVLGRGIAVDMNGAPLLTLEEVSMQGADMPPYKDLMRMGDPGAKPSFSDMKMSFKDMKLKKLDVTLPVEGGGDLSLAGFDMSFAMDKGSGALALKLDRLDMPTALLLKGNPMAPVLRDKLPPRILASKDVDLTVTGKEKNVADVAIKTLNGSVRDLGAYALSADLLDIDTAGGRTESLLRKLDLSLTDAGAIRTAFAVQAALAGGDPVASRAELAALIEAQSATLPNRTLQEMAGNILAFLKQDGGTLRLTIAPEKPLSTRAMRRMILTQTDKLGIASSFTPAK